VSDLTIFYLDSRASQSEARREATRVPGTIIAGNSLSAAGEHIRFFIIPTKLADILS